MESFFTHLLKKTHFFYTLQVFSTEFCEIFPEVFQYSITGRTASDKNSQKFLHLAIAQRISTH